MIPVVLAFCLPVVFTLLSLGALKGTELPRSLAGAALTASVLELALGLSIVGGTLRSLVRDLHLARLGFAEVLAAAGAGMAVSALAQIVLLQSVRRR